jgi:hypothetical protein
MADEHGAFKTIRTIWRWTVEKRAKKLDFGSI